MKRTFIALVILSLSYLFFLLCTTHATQIDKLYVMNLDKSINRYAEMDRALNALNLPIKHYRFSAIDGRTVKFINIQSKKTLTGAEILNQKIILKGDFHIICSDDTPEDIITVKLDWNEFHLRGVGEIGHTCSSRKIWQEIIKNKHKNTLIMEDDLHFIKFFDQYLTMAMNNVPNDYDFLYLNIWDHWSSYTYKRKLQNSVLRFSLNIFDQYLRNIFWKKVRRNVVSAKTYIITQETAKKLLKYTQNLPNNILVTDMVISILIEDENITAYSSKLQLSDDNGRFKSDVEGLLN